MSDTEKVFTLSDLRAWKRSAPSFAVLGKPIAHSLSPKMHNAVFSKLGEKKFGDGKLGDCAYFRFEIAPEELAEALPIFAEKNFLGLNLTIPHKVSVLPLLKKISDDATRTGAANTLSLAKNGKDWNGENTDGKGFSLAVKSQLGRELSGANIVLLGAGGAARAIATTALSENCASLTVANRSRERAETLVEDLRKNFPSAKIFVRGEFLPEEKNPLPQNALVVNATPLGLKPNDPSPIPTKFLSAGTGVFDTTYGATESALVGEARRAGVPAENGLSMLVAQGALAFEIWTCVPAKETIPIMSAALKI